MAMTGAFRCGHARGRDWQDAAQAVLGQLGSGAGNLGFVYATDLLADHLGEIVDFLRERTGVAHWTGTVGMGVCATGAEYMDEPALAVLTGDFDPACFRVFSGVRTVAEAQGAELACPDGSAHFAVVHADPQHRELPKLIEKLARRVDSRFLVGGLTSSRRENLQVADGIVEGGLSGVAFSDQVAIATRLTQGCSPVGSRHVVTEAQRNVVVRLDGRPALDVMREDIGEALSRDLNRLGGTVFAGLMIPGTDTGDYVVRHLVGIDPSSRLIAIGDYAKTGGELMFCRRDAKSARDDMARMLESIKEGLFARPRAGLYYSCLGRGAGLFGADAAELGMIRDALGEFPLAGFFCNGEISHHRLYGYTGVLTLFV